VIYSGGYESQRGVALLFDIYTIRRMQRIQEEEVIYFDITTNKNHKKK